MASLKISSLSTRRLYSSLIGTTSLYKDVAMLVLDYCSTDVSDFKSYEKVFVTLDQKSGYGIFNSMNIRFVDLCSRISREGCVYLKTPRKETGTKVIDDLPYVDEYWFCCLSEDELKTLRYLVNISRVDYTWNIPEVSHTYDFLNGSSSYTTQYHTGDYFVPFRFLILQEIQKKLDHIEKMRSDFNKALREKNVDPEEWKKSIRFH